MSVVLASLGVSKSLLFARRLIVSHDVAWHSTRTLPKKFNYPTEKSRNNNLQLFFTQIFKKWKCENLVMDPYSTPSNKMLQLQRCLSFSIVKFLSAINSKSKIIYICLPNSLSSCMLHFTMISCSTLAGFFSSYRASVGPNRSSLHHSAPV